MDTSLAAAAQEITAAAAAIAAPASASPASSAPQPHDPDPPVYEVNIKTIDGSTTKLEVPSDLRCSDLKELILDRLEVPINRQRLICRGRVLKDDDIIGQHITQSGQTVHMVQRPEPQAGQQQQQQPQQPAAGGVHAPPTMQVGPQVQFQFNTVEGGAPGGMPQVDLSQLLGTVFGAVGRGAPIGVVHTGPVPPAMPPPGGDRDEAGLWRRSSSSSTPQGPPPYLQQPGAPAAGNVGGAASSVPSAGPPGAASPQAATSEGGPSLQQPQGVPTIHSPPASAQGSTGGAGTGPAPPGSMVFSGIPLPVNGGADQGLAVGPQIIFQQGHLGNLAQVIPAMFGDTMQAGVPIALGGQLPMQPQPPMPGEGGQVQDPSAAGLRDPLGDTLPWRDLRRLNQHLARLLGRPSSQHRSLPPANMPNGELYSFLAVLLGAINQLGVATGDLQTSILDGHGPPPRHRLQFAMALIAAARTLRGAATAMQSGFVEGSPVSNAPVFPTAGGPTADRATASATTPASSSVSAAAPTVNAGGAASEQGAPSRPSTSPELLTAAGALEPDQVPRTRLEPPRQCEEDESRSAIRRGDSSDSELDKMLQSPMRLQQGSADLPVAAGVADGGGTALGVASAGEETEVLEFLEPVSDVLDLAQSTVPGPTGGALPMASGEHSGREPSVESASDEADVDAEGDTDVVGPASPAEMMQMLPQLISSLTQQGVAPQAAAGVGAQGLLSAVGLGGAGPGPGGENGGTGDRPFEEGLSAMPPEVIALWNHWTQPEPFRRVVAQAVQPPFSEAYISGDATGSQHPSAAWWSPERHGGDEPPA